MNEFLLKWVTKWSVPLDYHDLVMGTISFTLLILAAIVCYFVVKQIVVRTINNFFSRTETNLDDVLIEHKVFSRIAYLAPAWLIYKLTPAALVNYPEFATIIITLTAIYLVLVVVMLIGSLVDSALDIYQTFPVSDRVPIRNFGQVIKILTYFVALIIIASLMLGESPIKLFAGLGAMTAVLMLVFRDPILGFVAGLQLSYNNLVGVGDWVDIPQHNASGDIMEIGLTTVKVRNFDNTITTVPTQSLISESFKNWRGMQESAGRRIKRAINIDINTIRFCDEQALTRYRKVEYIKEYIDAMQSELKQYNRDTPRHTDSLVNGRRMTNIGTFRAYILAYLRNHPQINQQLTVLVRQLEPTDAGLPLEIYTFSSEKDWVRYEAIQADIFDHLFAVVKEFDLRVFQKPSGVDFVNFGELRQT